MIKLIITLQVEIDEDVFTSAIDADELSLTNLESDLRGTILDSADLTEELNELLSNLELDEEIISSITLVPGATITELLSEDE